MVSAIRQLHYLTLKMQLGGDHHNQIAHLPSVKKMYGFDMPTRLVSKIITIVLILALESFYIRTGSMR